jgi:hypothetical protein
VSFGIEDVTKKLKEGILANSIKFGLESKSVNEIIQHKENNKNKQNIDEILRQQKIKEIQENKESIGNKIKTLEENMRLLELDGNINLSKVDLNTSIKGEGVVDDNIRKSRIKEIKQTKELLERKLQTLDEHVQKLMTEEENNNTKKFNLKQYLDNFEKDKSEAANRAKKWEIEQKERIKHMMELEEKKKNKIKQKEQESLNQIKQKEKEREDAYYRNLDKRREKDKINHENLEKLKEEWKSRNSITQEYRFQKYEKDFLEQQEKEKEEKKKEDSKWLEERRNLLKPINKEEINEFSKKVVEERQKKMFEKEKKRMQVLEEIQQKNETLPKSETAAYQKAVEEAKQQKEIKEKEKLDKIYKNMKIKQFSKVIKTELLPKIDEKKKKELEERIVELQNVAKIKKHKRRSKTRVLLKKPDPNKPNKYKWKLKLDCSEDSARALSKGKSRSRSKSARSVNESRRKDLLNEDIIENNLKKRISRSRSGEKRKPMEKLPDYLTEMRIKKTQMYASKTLSNEEKSERDKSKIKIKFIFFKSIFLESDKKWQKMINNGKYSLMENVEQIKIKANMLEEQAKMKEKFLQLNGGAEKNPELGENVSNMLIDALKAKLTILESISKKK